MTAFEKSKSYKVTVQPSVETENPAKGLAEQMKKHLDEQQHAERKRK